LDTDCLAENNQRLCHTLCASAAQICKSTFD
jgi:hypothetical protein